MTTSGTTTDYSIMPSGATSFNISYLVTGPDGNVWFDGCRNNSTVSAGFLNVSTGAVTFYSNTGTPNVSCSTGIVGPMAVGSDGYVWYSVMDTGSGLNASYLYSVNTSAGTTSSAQGGSTNYDYFTGMTSGSDGRLYVTDSHNNDVYAYAVSSGSLTTGGGTYSVPTSSSYPESFVSGPDGNLWFVEGSNHDITKMTTSGTFTQYAQSTGVYPSYLAAGPDGAVWFTDTNSTPKIGRITSSGTVTEYTVPSSPYAVSSIALGPDGNMWFGYTVSGSPNTYGLESITTVPFFNNNHAISSSYTSPNSVTTANGSLWYAESSSSGYTNEIGNMTTSGTTTDYSIMPSGATSFNISYLVTGPDGNVWFDGCRNNSTVSAGFLNVSTGAVTFYSNTGTPNVSCSTGIVGPMAVGSDGYVWYSVMDTGSGLNASYLYSVNTSAGTTSSAQGGSTNYDYFTGMTSGSDGRLYVTDSHNNDVYAYAVSSGSLTTGGGTYSVPTSSSYPESIVSGPDGNLWFVEGSNHDITKMTTSGTFTQYAQSTGVYPSYLAAGPDGAVWFTDTNSTPKIGRITSSGTVTEYTVPSSPYAVSSIALGPDGNMWFGYTVSGSPNTYGLESIGY